MGTPHKHAALIHAWAEGAEIQCKQKAHSNIATWADCSESPKWSTEYEYRIKPQSVIRYGMLSCCKERIYISNKERQPSDSIKITLNPERTKILAVELLD